MTSSLAGTPDWLIVPNSNGTTTTYTAPITRAAGEGLLVCLYWNYSYGLASALTSLKWDVAGDNQPLTLVRTQAGNGDNSYISVWWLPAPTSAKTANLTATFSNTNIDKVCFETRHVTGHDAAVAVSAVSFAGSFGNTSGYATQTVSESIASVAGNLCVDFFYWRNAAASLTVGSGQGNVTINAPSNGTVLASSTLPGAATTTFSYSTGDAAYGYSHIIASITPVATAAVNLTAAPSTETPTSSTGAATVTPTPAGTVNLVAAPSTETPTSSTGAATVSSVTATVTSDVFKGFGGLALANLTVPSVMLIKLDRTVALSLANQVTNASGQLVVTSSALVSGTDYMLATFDATGANRGMKKVTAV